MCRIICLIFHSYRRWVWKWNGLWWLVWYQFWFLLIHWFWWFLYWSVKFSLVCLLQHRTPSLFLSSYELKQSMRHLFLTEKNNSFGLRATKSWDYAVCYLRLQCWQIPINMLRFFCVCFGDQPVVCNEMRCGGLEVLRVFPVPGDSPGPWVTAPSPLWLPSVSSQSPWDPPDTDWQENTKHYNQNIHDNNPFCFFTQL